MKTNHVLLSISDPWDLGEALKWAPLRGELLQTNIDDRGGRGLVRLDQAIEYRGTSCRFVVAAPRHEGDTIATAVSGGKVFCSFTGISDAHAKSDDALSTEHWRGGLAFIGDLQTEN